MATKEQRSKALTEILKRDGEVTASKVVEYARPKRSLIHDEIEWDVEKAAAEYQLSQARRLIRVTPVKIDGTGVEHRLIHVPVVTIDTPTAIDQEREGCYKPIAHVVASESEYERALRQLQVQVRAIERSIHELQRAHGDQVTLLPTLVDAMRVARDTIRLMLSDAGSAA